jgi:altronate hydrolase
VPLQQVAIRLHAQDHVAIAKTNLVAGTTLLLEEGGPVKVRQFIPSGHKVALSEVAPEAPVRRYGQIIGFASQAIQPGDHVHSQNLDVKDFARDYAFGVDVKPIDYVPEANRRTFMGYKRANGQVGTRNYIALISSVNCSAHTSREIAHYFTPERLAAFPNVDGVIALTHQLGCATRLGGHDYLMLQRTLAGMARHPNIGAYILVGLGCETNQISDLVDRHQLTRNGNGAGHEAPLHLVIQDEGGIRKTIEAGIAAVEKLLPLVNQAERTPQPVSEVMVGL